METPSSFFAIQRSMPAAIFDPTRSAFKQNQFGGTIGGPIKSDKIFFFGDYQGTRTDQGVSTGDISVPTLAQRGGTFNDLTSAVSGPYVASLLTQALGYTVTEGEPYTKVFPNGTIPQSAWSAPGKNLLQYIPSPNVTESQFSTSSFAQTVRDDKGAARIDLNRRLGQVSGYYFIDDYYLDNPYPGSVAGASIPGFDALYMGRAQLISLGDNKLIGANTVNELHLGYLRNAIIIGQPKGGLGVSLASQGFASGTNGGPGIAVQAPQFEGVENITFPTFVMGVPITNLTQVNDTYYLSDGLSKVIGAHTLKVGGQFHIDQVNDYPNGTFNGTFNINGTETGNPYADFLLGVPSNFTQSSGQALYLRNRYEGLYGQDSWRARSDLTINAGLRWDIIRPFWEKYNQLQTWVPGAQSTLYPGALPGLLVPGDPGIPKTHRADQLHELRSKNRAGLCSTVRSWTAEDALRQRWQGQCSGKLRHLLHGISRFGGWHYVRRATLRLQLSQPGAAAAGNSVHHGCDRGQ